MKPESKKNAPAEAPPAPEEGNIDKIRDILFGVQMRESDRKFARIEERLVQEINEMREDSRRRLDSLEEYIKGEISSLADRLANEQNGRVDAVKGLTGELKELAHNLDKKTTQINEQTVKSESDLRQQILTQSKNLSDEIQKRHN